MGLIAILAGAAGSEVLMLHVARHSSFGVLLALFTIWVLAPFAALVWAQTFARRWPLAATLAIVLISLAIYGDVALGPPRPQPAAMFLIVPLVSLLAIAVAVLLARRMDRA